MTEDTEIPLVIDFKTKRRERLHVVHDARLEQMRSEFEKAFPLPSKANSKVGKSLKKKKKPRKS